MAAFFTAEELMLQLQHTTDGDVDDDTATLLATLASDEIRDDLGQQIDLVTNEVITIYGDGGELIVLPQRPVIGVSSVLLNGQAITAYDWRRNGALRRVIFAGSQFAGEMTMNWPFGVPVQVTYSHGYATVPNAIKAAALDLAIATYMNPNSLVTSKIVDDVSEAYRATRAATMLSEERKNALDRYRALDM